MYVSLGMSEGVDVGLSRRFQSRDFKMLPNHAFGEDGKKLDIKYLKLR